MTPPERPPKPPVDRPFQRDTGDYAVGRGASERSATRPPPSIEIPTGPVSNGELMVEIRSIRAENDRLEGRLIAALDESEKRVKTIVRGPPEQRAEALAVKLEETQMDMSKTIAKWRRWVGLAFVLVGALLGGNVVQITLGHDITEAAETVAADVAETKAADIARDQQQTKTLSETNSARIDKLESKIDNILELLQRPAPIVVPAQPLPKKHK